MKKNKLKNEKYENEELKLVKNLIVILLIVVLFSLGFYFLTDKVVIKEKINNQETEINYDKATVGTMLNRPYDEYLVLLFNSEESEAAYYGTLLSNYDGDKKIYFVDLSLKTNEAYVSEKSSGVFKDVKDAKFSGPTLLEISESKVKNFLETKEEIKKALSNEKN